jgi:hypothetical protein
MRPKRTLRKSRRVQVATGALMLAIPTSAVALAAGQADAQSAQSAGATLVRLTPRFTAYGHKVTVDGYVSPSAAGQSLLLEYAPAGGSNWGVVGTTRVPRSGHFRVTTPVQESGLMRVVAGEYTSHVAKLADVTLAPSATQRVTVRAELLVRKQAYAAIGNEAVNVRGHLLPAKAGRKVVLEARSGGSWHWLASARTGPRGGFDLRYRGGASGQQPLRVRFAGDRLNTRTSSPAGQLTGLHPSVASWYDDAGATASGFHAYYGVANRDLPFGTQVTISYGGHTVTATVDDRGPFVGGRDWDLNQNVAAALGFNGVDTVWVSS